jgi:hypothetical protein
MTFTDADLAYIRAGFVPLAELAAGRREDVAALIARRLLPEPTYVLPDGTEMVPVDYFALADEAGGPEALPEEFARRCVAAGARPEDVEDEWDAYLSGEYGVCLREVTPEAIVRKGVLVDSITALLEAPAPDAEQWRAELRAGVDELDALEREFSPDYDRSDRFPLAPTQDRLIRAARERYADAFRAATHR